VLDCHSVYTLPVGVALKIFKRCRLVYSTHELETERNGLSGLFKTFTKAIERFGLRFCDSVLVVNRPIKDWYVREYGKRLPENTHVVHNIPDLAPLRWSISDRPMKMRDALGIPTDKPLFIYQGLLVADRGIEMALRIFAHSVKDKNVVFMGHAFLEG